MKYLLNFLNFNLNERFTIKNSGLKNNIVLLKTNDDIYYMLYNITTKKQLGYISFNYNENVDVYTIDGVYAKSGYGAFLYETAMTYVYPKGCSLTRQSNTSPEALDVWDKFNKRNDVYKERMYSDEITHKKEDLSKGGFYNDNPKYLEYIFELEDTKFFYSYGKDVLEKLLEKGNTYKIENNISDDDIEGMCWDLE